MSAITLTQKERNIFEALFVDMAEAKANGRREDVARAAFAIMEPMKPAQEAMNRYKRRVSFAIESGNTAFGLAAVQAFQNDLLACAARGDQLAKKFRMEDGCLSRRAADLASNNAVSREIDFQPSFIQANRVKQGLEAWLGEKLAELDALIAAEDSPSAGLGPR